MKTTKMSLANIQGKLSRAEMKQIMAGSQGAPGFCGDRGTSVGCPSGTTAQKCDQLGSAYCLETGTGLCKTYGTATCSYP